MSIDSCTALTILDDTDFGYKNIANHKSSLRYWSSVKLVARLTGFEPATTGIGIRYSILLSYRRICYLPIISQKNPSVNLNCEVKCMEIYDPKSATSYYNIAETARVAVENFQCADLDTMIENCGFTKAGDGFDVHFIQRDLHVSYPLGEVTDKASGEKVDETAKILVLHHAAYSKGGGLVEDMISYKQLPSGEIYVDPFTRRCINALVGIFASNLEALKKAIAATDHKIEKHGDFSGTIQVMPKVPITLIIYEEDDEFPAAGNILFNGNAANHLHTEDYSQISAYLISALKKIAFQ